MRFVDLLADRALFPYVCSFLSLEDKVHRLLSLNKAMTCTTTSLSSANQHIGPLFDWSMCCRDDILVIHWVASKFQSSEEMVSRCLRQIELAKKVRHVHVNIVEPFDDFEEDSFIDLIRNLAANDLLETLCLYDDGSENDERVSCDFFTCFLDCVIRNRTPRTKLKKFHCSMSRSMKELGNIDWADVWSLCPSVEDIDWSLGTGWSVDDTPNSTSSTLLSKLPSSLQHITLTLRSITLVGSFCWESSFRSPTFLPVLRTFRCWSTDMKSKVPTSLCATVMNQTGLPRPILHISIDSLNDFHQMDCANFTHLTTIHVDGYRSEPNLSLDDLVNVELPYLRIFTFQGDMESGVSTIDLLLLFLARRPIQKLALINCGSVLTIEGARALSSLTQLRYLRLSPNNPQLDPMLHVFDPIVFSPELISQLIAPGCFPELRHVSGDFDVIGLECLLHGAPHVRQVWVYHSDEIAFLAIIGHYCPLVESIVLTKRLWDDHCFRLPPVEVDVVKRAFDLHPLLPASFQRLVHVGLRKWPSNGLTAQAFHCLITHFQRAPQLQLFDTPALSTQHRLLTSYFMIRSLPRVRELRGKVQSQAMLMYEQSPHVERAYVPSNKWPYQIVEYCCRSMRGAAAEIDKELDKLSYPLDVDTLNAEMHWYEVSDDPNLRVTYQDRGYLRFVSEEGSNVLDGREMFLQELSTSLADKMIPLAKWDAGQYDVPSDDVSIYEQNDKEEYHDPMYTSDEEDYEDPADD